MENAKKPFYRYCVVPECRNTIVRTPDKVFFSVPKGVKIRKQWFKVIRRDEGSPTSPLYCCEDHFNIKEDTQNYIQYNIMKQQGVKVLLRLKEGVVPHKFQCRKRNMPTPQERMCAVKSQRLSLIDEPGHSTFHIEGCDDYQVCRVCLAVDVKMYDMKDYRLSEMFKDITGISACDEKESIHRVCWECAARLAAAAAFRDKALLSNALLKDQVHLKISDIKTLKQIYHSTLKSPLTIQTVFTSYDIDCGDTNSENKEIEFLSDERDTNKIKTELTIQEEGTDLEEEKPLIDFFVKTEVEYIPMDENNFNIQTVDVKSETFSEINHFDDTVTFPLDNSEDEIENTEVQITNNGVVLRDDYKNTNAPKNYGCDNNLVDDLANNSKLDVIVTTMNESSREEDTQSLEEVASAKKAKIKTSRNRLRLLLKNQTA